MRILRYLALLFLLARALPAQIWVYSDAVAKGRVSGVNQTPAAGDMIWAFDSQGHFKRTAIGAVGKCWMVLTSTTVGWNTCGGGGGGGGGLSLTTKGDLHTYDSADVRLGVGSNGFALFADSAQSKGILWRAIAEADVTSLATDLSARPTGSGTSGQAAYWSGASTVTGDTHFTWDSANQRLGVTEIRLAGVTSGYSGLVSPSVGGNVTWSLPPVDGSAGQVIKTNGAGRLDFATVLTTTQTSPNIPYAGSSATLADSSLAYDSTDKTVTQTGSSTATPRGIVVKQVNTGAQSARLFLRKSNGSIGAETAAGSTNNIGAIAFQANQGSGVFDDVAQISVSNTAAASGGFGTGILQFFTANGAAVQEHLRIAANGDVSFTPDASHYTGLKGSTSGTGVVYTLPPADGTSGQCVQTNGSASLTFGTCTGGGSSAISSSIGTFAAMGSAATAGAGSLYYTTDSVYNPCRSNGSTWDCFVGNVLTTDPNLQTWTWQNQGSSTVDTTLGGIYMDIPSAAADSVRIYEFTPPETPYTVTAMIMLNFDQVASATGQWALIGWKETGTGKLAPLAVGVNSGGGVGKLIFISYQYTSPTVFSATYIPPSTIFGQYGFGNVICLRCTDDGTNRIQYVSQDCIHYRQVHTIGRTNFLTPARFFFGVNTTNSRVAGATLVSLKVQ